MFETVLYFFQALHWKTEGAKTKDANLAIPTIALRLKLILASDTTERQTKKQKSNQAKNGLFRESNLTCSGFSWIYIRTLASMRSLK